MTGRARCPERRCGWSGPWSEALAAPHPGLDDDTIYGCPWCKEFGGLEQGCHKSGCSNPWAGSVPTDQGPVDYCGRHWPEGAP